MKALVTGAVLLVLCLSPLPAGAAREDYTGRVTFRDGTVLTYTWLSVRHDEIPCARDLSDMKDYGAGSIRLLLPAIAKIDFDNSAAVRKRIASILPGYQADSVRRATVTFHDGTVYSDVYVDCAGEWGNAREKGRLTLPGITSLSIAVANVAVCPKCDRHFAEPSYAFCPRDGEKLSRPVRQKTAGLARPGARRSRNPTSLSSGTLATPPLSGRGAWTAGPPSAFCLELGRQGFSGGRLVQWRGLNRSPSPLGLPPRVSRSPRTRARAIVSVHANGTRPG